MRRYGERKRKGAGWRRWIRFSRMGRAVARLSAKREIQEQVDEMSGVKGYKGYTEFIITDAYPYRADLKEIIMANEVEFRTVRVFFKDGVKRPVGTLAIEPRLDKTRVSVALSRFNAPKEPCWDKEEGRERCQVRLDQQREHSLMVPDRDIIGILHPSMKALLNGRVLSIPKREVPNLIDTVRFVLGHTQIRFGILNREDV